MQPTAAVFEKLLDENPGDMDARWGYALWLHDEGDDRERAVFMRWCIANNKYPVQSNWSGYNSPKSEAAVWWDWYLISSGSTGDPSHCFLPAVLHVLHVPSQRSLLASYRTRSEAEDVLFEAWTHWQNSLPENERFQ